MLLCSIWQKMLFLLYHLRVREISTCVFFLLKSMYLIAIAWMYVALMMALAEATAPQGSILGACITLLLYGVLPCSLLLYILGTPKRKRRLHAERLQAQRDWDAAQQAATSSTAASTPDGSGHTPCSAVDTSVAPVREKL